MHAAIPQNHDTSRCEGSTLRPYRPPTAACPHARSASCSYLFTLKWTFIDISLLDQEIRGPYHIDMMPQHLFDTPYCPGYIPS